MGADVSFAITARDQASRTLSRVGHNVDQTGDSVDRLGRGFAKFGTVAAVAIGAAAAAGAAFLLKVGAPYVDSLNKIQTLTGSTDAVMKRTASTLEDNAGLYAKMGMTTGDAAAGVVELTKAGMSLSDSMKAVNATMVLAKAGEMDVADASALVSNTLGVFKLKATEAARVANVLANAANVSSADVSDLSQSLSMVANVAAGSGASIEQTSAMLAELANAGMKGSDAGTSLKTMLLSLQAPSSTAAAGLKELGVSAFNMAGQARPIRAVLGDLDKQFAGLTDQKRMALLKGIFGTDAFRAAKVIFGNGATALDKYTRSVQKAGAAQALANSASKGLMGTLQMLKARAVSWGQAMYRQWSPIADDLIRNKLVPAIQAIAHWMGKNRAAIEPVAAVLAGMVVGIIAVTAAVKAWVAIQIVLNAVMTANPIALIIVAIAGLVAGLIYAYNHSESFRKVIDSIGQVIKTKVFPIISSFVGFVKGSLIPIIQQTADKVAHNLKPIWEQLVTTFQTQVMPIISKVLAKFHEWQPTIQKVIEFVAKMIGKWIEFQSSIAGKVIPVLIKLAGYALVAVVKQFEIMGKIVTWVWNNAMQPALKMMATAVSVIISTWARMLDAMSHVPGFGWAKDAAASMQNAADKAKAIADGIRKIPTRKDVQVTVHYDYEGLKDPTRGHGDEFSAVGKAAAGAVAIGIMSKAGAVRRAGMYLGDLGVHIITNVIDGIRGHKVALGTAIDKMTDYVSSKVDKLKGLLSAKSDFAAQFQSFTSSVFSHSFTNAQGEETAPTIGSMLAYEQRERSKMMRLRRDATKLIKMGLSKDLIRQLAASGESGIAQIHALAQGTRGQIQQFNMLNQGVNNALSGLGNLAGDALYGDQIRQTQHEVDVARDILKDLRDLLKKQDKDVKIQVYLDGHQIRSSLVKIKRESGKNLGLA